MAKVDMKKVERARSNPGTRVRVGHNRDLQFNADGSVTGWLWGNRIMDYKPASGILILDSCGYRTATTRNAWNDFCAALGVPVKVSFADGMTTFFSWKSNIQAVDAFRSFHDGELARFQLDALTMGNAEGIRVGMAKADSMDHRHAATVCYA